MCFQGFVYYACGHNFVNPVPCELLSDHPYAMLAACPNYHYSSAYFTGVQGRPLQYCGIGRFYCNQDRDGAFLDRTYDAEKHAQSAMDGIDASLAELHKVTRNFIIEANGRGMSEAAQEQHPQRKKIAAAHRDWLQKRNAAQAIKLQSTTVIQEAQEWYLGKMQHQLSGDPTAYPAFVPPTHLPRMVSDVLGGGAAHYVTTNALASSSTYGTTLGVGITDSKPKLLPSWQQPPPEAAAPIAGHRQLLLKPCHGQMQPPRPSDQKPRRTRKPLLKDADTSKSRSRPRVAQSSRESSVQADAGSVRRSARVQKKISYAEDTESSREPSPDKSDVSGFSPTKSDAAMSERSDSPDKGVNTRRALLNHQAHIPDLTQRKASLSDKIKEWKKSQLLTITTPVQHRTSIGLKDVLNTPPEKDIVHNSVVGAHSAQLEPAAPFTHATTNTPSVAFTPPSALTGTAPSGIPTVLASQNLQHATMNNYTRLLQNYPAAAINRPSSLPQQRSTYATPLDMQQPQYGVPQHSFPPTTYTPLAVPYGTPQSHYASPAQPGFPVGMPVVTPGYPAAACHSVATTQAPPSHNYVHRSLSLTPSLTPSTLYSQPIITTEPNKRPFPFSSPLLPQMKRRRPTEQTATGEGLTAEPNLEGRVLGEQSPPQASSPPRPPPFQISRSSLAHPKKTAVNSKPLQPRKVVVAAADPVLAPSPTVFAPAALMSVPSPQAEQSIEDNHDAPSEAGSTVHSAIVEGENGQDKLEVEDAAGSHHMEIEWAVHDDDELL